MNNVEIEDVQNAKRNANAEALFDLNEEEQDCREVFMAKKSAAAG